MRDTDALAIVEAAYAVDVSDEIWLERIAGSCRPILDGGFGVCVFEFRYHEGAQPQIFQTKMLGIPEELAKLYPVVFASMDDDVRVRPFAHGPCTTASQMMGQREEFRANPLMQRYAQKFGIFDSMWITAAEPSGFGCGIHVGLPEIGRPSRSTIERWSRIAAHLSAGARLRRDLPRSEPHSIPQRKADEAVLSPAGKLHHAEGPASAPDAIAHLRQAVIDMERARGPKRALDEASCLSAWKGLVDARWSLLDRFENDGKRYIVARENAPNPPGPSALTLRERQVVGYAAFGHENKTIAYDLGIAHSTVRVLIARAASKLGAKSRAELIRCYQTASLGAPSPASQP